MGIIDKINRLNARDPMVSDIMDAIQQNLNEQNNKTAQIGKAILFDECSEEVLVFYEKEAGLDAGNSLLEDRRSAVMAKWLSSNVPSLKMVQRIADSWSYGKTECSYDELVITVKFVDKGIPTGIEELKAAIEEAIPAHLKVEYVITYNTWNDIANMTWAEASASTWEELMVR